MARILIVGLAGHNLGDDAIALCSAAALRQHHVTVTTVQRGRLIQYGIDELLLNRKSLHSLRAIFQEMRRADLVLMGGGSLIQDKLGVSLLRGVLAFFLQMVVLARLSGARVATLPIGVDQLDTRLGRLFGRVSTRLLEGLAVRDVGSMLLVRKALGYKGPIRVAADPVALLPMIRRPVDRHKVVLSLAKENLNHAKLVTSAETFCRRMISAGREVILLIMDARAGEEVDIYDVLVERLKPSVRIFQSDNVYQVQQLLAEAGCLVSCRLHPMIIGLPLLPVVGLSRTTKTDIFCSEHEIPFVDVNSDWQHFAAHQVDVATSDRLSLVAKQELHSKSDRTKVESFFSSFQLR